jgi:small subunit ribosomal protein S2
MAPAVGIRELLEAGVHFGHQTRRWNPKMRRFIHGEREGIYIIDLLKTEDSLTKAQEFAEGIARRGGVILFVGTKKQARDSIKEVAEANGQPYVNHRWLGGVLTNFQTISQRIKRLHDLERFESEGQLALLPTQERMTAQADLAKLQANLGGVKNMQRPPDAMFVVDLKVEDIAVKEAKRLRIPIIGLVDTNCDPDGISYVVPGNDDGLKACATVTAAIGDAIASGRSVWQRAEEERIKREAEEAQRRQAEEQARREAEEQARADAEAAQRAEREAAQAAQAERVAQEQAAAAATPAAQQATQDPTSGEGSDAQAPKPAPTVDEEVAQAAPAAPAAAKKTAAKKKAAAKPKAAPKGAAKTDPGSSEDPAGDAAAAAEAVVEADAAEKKES